MRYQLPVYSPLSAGQIVRACTPAFLRPRASLRSLESALGIALGGKAVLLTGSGTQALQLALAVAAEGAAPVALPAYSCYDVASAAAGAGVPVVFYDIDPLTLTPRLGGIRDALSAGARTVVAGYLFGFPLDWGVLREECRAFGATLIEDAAQGIGASWDGVSAGGHGDLSILSFGRGKGWTGGGGGTLVARDSRWVGPLERARAGMKTSPLLAEAKSAALVTAQWLMGRPSLFSWVTRVPGARLGETHYKPPVAPRLITAFSSAVVLAHAAAASTEASARRHLASTWVRVLSGDPAIAARAGFCAPIDADLCGFLRFPLLLGDGAADAVVRRGAHLGVSRAYPRTLPELEEMAEHAYRVGTDFPGAKRLARSLVGLPTHSLMSPADLDRTLLLLSGYLGEEIPGGGMPARG